MEILNDWSFDNLSVCIDCVKENSQSQAYNL